MNNNIKCDQSGFSLIEVVIAIFVATLIGIAAVSLLKVRAGGIEDTETVQRAENSTEEALSALTATAADLAVGGSFSVDRSGKVDLGNCTAQTCDLVLSTDAIEDQRTSPAKGVPYGQAGIRGKEPPLFVRRWRVDDIDGNYQLRKITVAVFKDEKSIDPIVIEESTVGVTK